jgi:class 3 adenylate cyclase
MRCARCHNENPHNARFCIGCGAALSAVCPTCGHANPPYARFCGQCAATLPALPPAPAQSGGELKQITLLFADVSGSTELIESLDPEEGAKRLAPAIDAMQEAVRRFDGSVVRVQGDGIMALFGTPKPQEDHAVRACCAALALQSAIKALPGTPLLVRVGIHSGEVLARTVATDFSTDFDAAGVTVHIANRLESLAPVGSTVVSSATRRAARQFISVESLGSQAIRGLSAPMEIFLLTGLRRGPTSQRFSAEETRSNFIGRERDLEFLTRSLERAAEGDGCAVGIVAEAGVGKSRLCFEFAQRCRTAGVRVLEGRALAHGRATPFEPIIDFVNSIFEVAPGETPARAREKIAAGLERIDQSLTPDLPLLVDFLGLADPGQPRETSDPTARRERLNTFFRRLARLAGRETAAVILLEDLHFMDSGSESLIEVLADALSGTRLLLLVNFRPGYAAPWMRGDRYDQLALPPLRQSAADDLAQHLLGADESVASLLPLIADRARGNPFFIEELVRKFDESGVLAGEVGNYRLLLAPDMNLIPDTVQAIVAARVDSRPEAERALLQTAAVIGREFAAPMLERIAGVAGMLVNAGLHRLSAAGLIYETDGSSAGTFAFKHPMVQEVVYRSQISERRRALHAAVASELEKTVPDPNGAQAGVIAYHLEEAGNIPLAASYNMKSATWHGYRDPAQAFDAWKRARRLLLGLPLEGAAKYPLVMASGQIVNCAWRVGLSAADVEPNYKEAVEIARSLGDMRTVAFITAAFGRMLTASGSASEYVEKVSEALAMLEGSRDPSPRIVLSAVLCQALRHSGDLRQALEVNDMVLAHAHEVSDFDNQTLGFNVTIWAKVMRGHMLVMMARHQEARAFLDEVIAGDDAMVDATNRLVAHASYVDMAWGTGDVVLATHHSAAAHKIGEKSGNPYLMTYGRAYAGFAQGLRGEYSEAATTLSEALRFSRRRHAGLDNEARMLADLAYVQMRAGLGARARATAEEAATVARRRGAKLWLAYAEWLIGGPQSLAFNQLVQETGAELLTSLTS